MPWNIFFSMHRHYKTNFVLITQSYANLDRRIRANIEYQHQHVNIKNATHVTHILLGWLPDFMFCSNQFYANGRERIATHWVFCRRKYTRLYNTFDRDGLTASGTVPDSGTVTETDGGKLVTVNVGNRKNFYFLIFHVDCYDNFVFGCNGRKPAVKKHCQADAFQAFSWNTGARI